MISTTNITENLGGEPKTLQPGNVKCTITSIALEPSERFKAGSANLVLHLEGPDMGPGFEGFLLDKDNPEKGRHKGQVGRVKTSKFPYSDGVTKKGVEISRDRDIVRMLSLICKETQSLAWFESQDNQHDTVESLVKQMNVDKPFAGKQLNFCISGKEYTNKEGYVNYELFLDKFTKQSVPFESADVDESHSKVKKFDPAVDLERNPLSKSVKSFGDGEEASHQEASKDFEL